MEVLTDKTAGELLTKYNMELMQSGQIFRLISTTTGYNCNYIEGVLLNIVTGIDINGLTERAAEVFEKFGQQFSRRFDEELNTEILVLDVSDKFKDYRAEEK